MKDTEGRINGMTLNEYLNFIRVTWRKQYRRPLQRHSKEEMEVLAREKRLKRNKLCKPIRKSGSTTVERFLKNLFEDL